VGSRRSILLAALGCLAGAILLPLALANAVPTPLAGSGSATSIAGKPVSTTAPTNGQCLVYSTSTAKWAGGSCGPSTPVTVANGGTGTATGSITGTASSTLTFTSAQVDGASPAILLNTTNAVTAANPLLRISNAGTTRMELLVNGSNLYQYFYNSSGTVEGGFITTSTPGMQVYNFTSFAPFSDGNTDLGTTNAVWGTTYSRLYSTVVGNALSSNTTITPIRGVHHVTGTTTITTITVPSGFTGTLVLIPDGLWSTNTGGNIAKATTAVVGKALHMTYDGTSWYPSY